MDSIIKSKVGITGELKLTFENVNTGEKEILEYKNLVVGAGKHSIIQRLVGTDQPENIGEISHCAVGTGANTPAASDTQLVTEIFRKQVSTRSGTGATATYITFFTVDEANDSLTEIGLFGDDATLTANSGTLFCVRSISRTKTNTETLSIEWQVSIS